MALWAGDCGRRCRAIACRWAAASSPSAIVGLGSEPWSLLPKRQRWVDPLQQGVGVVRSQRSPGGRQRQRQEGRRRKKFWKATWDAPQGENRSGTDPSLPSSEARPQRQSRCNVSRTAARGASPAEAQPPANGQQRGGRLRQRRRVAAELHRRRGGAVQRREAGGVVGGENSASCELITPSCVRSPTLQVVPVPKLAANNSASLAASCGLMSPNRLRSSM